MTEGQRLAPLAGFFRVGVADLVGGHDFGDSFFLFLYEEGNYAIKGGIFV